MAEERAREGVLLEQVDPAPWSTPAPLFRIALAAWVGLQFLHHLPLAPVVWLVGAGVGGLCAWWGRGWLRTAGVLGMAACAFSLYAVARLDALPPDHLRRLVGTDPRGVVARLEVAEDPVVRGAGEERRVEFRAEVRALQEGGWRPARGRVMVRLEGGGPPPRYGDLLEATGFLVPPDRPTNPGQFDYRHWLAGQGIHHVFHISGGAVEILARDGGWGVVRMAIAFKHHMQRMLAVGLDPEDPAAGLMSGMLFGFRDGISEPMREDFRVTGTMHLFAVSGQNVGIILAVLLLVLQMAGVIRWRWAWTMLPAVLVFCLSTGMQPSAFRAFVMAALVALGWAIYRPVGLFNILGGAALVMALWDPAVVGDLGFQLSFCVVLGMGWLVHPLHGWLRVWGQPDPWIPRRLVPWWRMKVAQGWDGCSALAAVSVAAWVASLPLTWWHFQLVSPVALLANMAVVPLAGGVVVLSALSVSLGALWINLAAAANWMSSGLLGMILAVVSHLAALPGGHGHVARPWELPPETVPRLTVLHHRQASPAVLHYGGRAWLLDPGPEGGWRHAADPYRRRMGIDAWEGVVLSNGGTRRLGAARAVLEATPGRWWAESGWRSRSTALHQWLDAMEAAGVPKRFWRAGERVDWGRGITVEVLHPGGEVMGERLEDMGLVLRIHLPHGATVLWAADAGARVEALLLAGGRELRADVLVQGEHPIEENLTPDWLAAVRPRRLIRPGRGYQPDKSLGPDFWETVRELGIEVLRLDRTGAVRVDFTPGGVEARAFLPNRPG